MLKAAVNGHTRTFSRTSHALAQAEMSLDAGGFSVGSGDH
jgi:hypothetical protein